jgi:hypothetical protein
MRPPGSFKIARRYHPECVSTTAAANSDADACLPPLFAGAQRSDRILDSLREEILESGEGSSLRIRRVFREPSELFRLELRLPEFDYSRTTLLGREALEELLETDGVRSLVEAWSVGR